MMVFLGGMIASLLCLLLALLFTGIEKLCYDNIEKMRERLARKSSPSPPPAQPLTPYRGDIFGQNLSTEMLLREENESLRAQLKKQDEELSKFIQSWNQKSGERLVLNGRYLDVFNRDGALIGRHSLRDLRRKPVTLNFGPR